MNFLYRLFAATDKISPDSIGLKNPVTNANTALNGLLNLAYTMAGIVCVIIIIIAGYLYVTSSGNASTIKRAKDAILGAVIGIVVIMVAFTITQFVIGRF